MLFYNVGGMAIQGTKLYQFSDVFPNILQFKERFQMLFPL